MTIPERHDLVIVGIPLILAAVAIVAWWTRSGDPWLIGGSALLLLSVVADALFRNPPN